jgi:hypothetical protein
MATHRDRSGNQKKKQDRKKICLHKLSAAHIKASDMVSPTKKETTGPLKSRIMN